MAAPLLDWRKALASEVVAEKAAALRRVAGHLEAFLAELQALGERAATNPGSRSLLAPAFNRTLEKARLWRFYLEVQREAIGLRSHDVLDELYKVPAPMR